MSTTTNLPQTGESINTVSSNTQITCTRKLQFCAGHRVMGHENKCAHLHGHNYIVHVTAQADNLDSVGRIVDFSVLKKEVGEWIEINWDHGFLLNEKDHEAVNLIKGFMDGNQKLYLLDENPTAENIATFLVNLGNKLLKDYGINVVKVLVWETPNCYAEANLDFSVV